MTFCIIFLTFLTDSSAFNAGDELFRAQDYAGAMDAYISHTRAHSNDVEAYWRLARAAICAGDVSPANDKETFYRKALAASEAAVRLDSLHSNAQCWYAVSLGYKALREGNRKKVELCRSIQKALSIAITIDPNNDVAYSIYGSFYRALGNINWVERQLADLLLGGLPDGGFVDAERMLKKAVELSPTTLRHRYELGMVYFDWGKQEQGKETFRSALNIQPILASDHDRIQEMKKKLLL